MKKHCDIMKEALKNDKMCTKISKTDKIRQ